MEPAETLLFAVGGVAVLAIAGVSTWMIIRMRRQNHQNAEHERIMKERAQRPETPPRRPTSASESEPRASETTSRPTSTSTSSPATSTTTSEATVSTSQPAANDRPAKDLPLVIVDNRKKRHAVQPGAVIELKTPTLLGRSDFQASRNDVGVRLIESGPNLARIVLDGACGQVNIALVEKLDGSTSRRVVTSWKFDLQAA